MPWREETAGEERKRAERYKDVPMVVAPGQEEAYLQDLERGNTETEQAGQESEQREKRRKKCRFPQSPPRKRYGKSRPGKNRRPYRPTRTVGMD